MKLTFIGAVHEVTGSCTLLEACGKKILIDCGMEQGENIYENCDIPVAPGEIDAVLVTHAHIDHSGMLPALTAQGYNGPIYATLATQKLCNIMLRDSAHIQESEAEWQNRKAKRSGKELYIPKYTMADAECALGLFKPFNYDEETELFDGIKIKFIDAGHLLGSASIYITLNENGEKRTIIFSGDVGNVSRPLIRDPQKPPYADYAVIESTYGDRLHGPHPDYIGQLTKIIQSTLDRGGNVVIPSFAVGRTQELLYLIRHIKENKLIKNHDRFPVYVDSPLAVEATTIYSSNLVDFYDSEVLSLLEKGINPLIFDGLKMLLTSDESKKINDDPTPKIILSASGMCDAGRIRHHLKHNLWRKESTVLFVGYQSEGTIGRKLINGVPTIKLFGEDIEVNAKIEQLDGISGHADRDMLLGWLKNMGKSPKRVFVNHGSDTVCDDFVKSVEETLGYDAVAPFSGDCYDLKTNQCIAKGKIVKINKQSEGRRKANQVFDKLLAAGQRLIKVINQNKNGANKDLARFASQIEALCDKYEQ